MRLAYLSSVKKHCEKKKCLCLHMHTSLAKEIEYTMRNMNRKNSGHLSMSLNYFNLTMKPLRYDISRRLNSGIICMRRRLSSAIVNTINCKVILVYFHATS